MNRSFVRVLTVFAAVSTGCASSGPKGFGADLGKQQHPEMGTIRIPYASVVDYFGHLGADQAPDAERDGQKIYYLYVWLPTAVPELGVRLAAPVDELAQPNPAEGDVVATGYSAGAQRVPLDRRVSLERAAAIVSAAELDAKWDSTEWLPYGANEEVLRVGDTPEDPNKALVRGLYRIGLAAAQDSQAQGVFVAQVGAPVDLEGIVVGANKGEVLGRLGSGAAQSDSATSSGNTTGTHTSAGPPAK